MIAEHYYVGHSSKGDGSYNHRCWYRVGINHFFIAVDSFDFTVDFVSNVVDRIREGMCHKINSLFRINRY